MTDRLRELVEKLTIHIRKIPGCEIEQELLLREDVLALLAAALAASTQEADDEQKVAFDNGSGMTEVMTVPEMIAEIQRLGKRCEALLAAAGPTTIPSAEEMWQRTQRPLRSTHKAAGPTEPPKETP